MQKTRICRYTQSIIWLLMIIDTCFSSDNLNTKQKFCDVNNELISTLKTNEKLLKAWHEYDKIFIPCSTFANHKVNDTDVDIQSIGYIRWWLQIFLTSFIFNPDSVEYLTDIYTSHDDVVIGNGVRNDVKYEFIDGRRLFIILKSNDFGFSRDEIIKHPNSIFESISQYIHERGFNILGEPIYRIVDSSQYGICFEVYDTLFVSSYKLEERGRSKILISKDLILFDIDKIRIPFRSKLGYIDSKTVGGISTKDLRPYKRFDKVKKTDLHNEIIKLFGKLPEENGIIMDQGRIPVYPVK